MAQTTYKITAETNSIETPFVLSSGNTAFDTLIMVDGNDNYVKYDDKSLFSKLSALTTITRLKSINTNCDYAFVQNPKLKSVDMEFTKGTNFLTSFAGDTALESIDIKFPCGTNLKQTFVGDMLLMVCLCIVKN